jgi:hypothetical protein
VERTVEDVLPALKTNSDGLKQVLEELLKQYKSKQDEMDRWKVRPRRPCRCPASVERVKSRPQLTVYCYRRKTMSKSSRANDGHPRFCFNAA